MEFYKKNEGIRFSMSKYSTSNRFSLTGIL